MCTFNKHSQIYFILLDEEVSLLLMGILQLPLIVYNTNIKANNPCVYITYVVIYTWVCTDTAVCRKKCHPFFLSRSLLPRSSNIKFITQECYTFSWPLLPWTIRFLHIFYFNRTTHTAHQFWQIISGWCDMIPIPGICTFMVCVQTILLWTFTEQLIG